MTSERIFFEDDKVKITAERAVFYSKTFILANITSITPVTKPARIEPAAMAILIGIFFLILCPMAKMVWTGVALGAVLIIPSILAIIFLIKPTYVLKLGTAGGEQVALSSGDADYINEISKALEQAIEERGKR